MKCVKSMATLTTVIMMMFLKTNALDSIYAVTVPYVFISNLARDFFVFNQFGKKNLSELLIELLRRVNLRCFYLFLQTCKYYSTYMVNTRG